MFTVSSDWGILVLDRVHLLVADNVFFCMYQDYKVLIILNTFDFIGMSKHEK